ncbi:MAG: hypothetical protein EXX96DRAFT_638932 [Benjaminiella poitrasii]|nr:MAG: hypothetical protein EXX96DRAFT_638932 [Benjaminiella poitrasii]
MLNLLELELENQRLTHLRSTMATRSQSKRQRSVITEDNIKVRGLTGILGQRILLVGDNIEMKGWKSKCVDYLSRNIIIDFSGKRQLKTIGIKLLQLQKYSIRSV